MVPVDSGLNIDVGEGEDKEAQAAIRQPQPIPLPPGHGVRDSIVARFEALVAEGDQARDFATAALAAGHVRISDAEEI